MSLANRVNEYSTKAYKAAEGGIVSVCSQANRAVKNIASSNAANIASGTMGYMQYGLGNLVASQVPLIGDLLANKLILPDGSKKLMEVDGPESIYNKLEAYHESYDLSEYKKLCEEAQKKTFETSSALFRQRDDKFNVSESQTIEKLFNPSSGLADRTTRLEEVNKALGGCIPKTKLSDIQQQYKKISLGIRLGEKPTEEELGKDPALAAAKDDPDFLVIHRPQEVLTAFKANYQKTKEVLKAEREVALSETNKLFEATPTGTEPSEFKKNLAALLGLDATQLKDASQVDPLLAQHKQTFIQHIEDSYKKAESALKNGFEDTKGQKDAQGKEQPDTKGLMTRANGLKQTCELDLLDRIREYEYRKSLDPQASLPNEGFEAGVGVDDASELLIDPSCLKNIRLEQIKQMELAGFLWGKRTLSGEYTTSGTEIRVVDIDGVSNNQMNVPGFAFPYHKDPSRLQRDFNSLAVKTLKSKQEKEITWTIEARTDELRNAMIIAAYKASKAQGLPDKKIIMTVKGGSKEQSFISKPISEILDSIPNLNANDAKHIQELRDKQQKTVDNRNEGNNSEFTSKYNRQLDTLKARGISTKDEIDLTAPQNLNTDNPGYTSKP